MLASLRAQGCPWNEQVFAEAVEAGELEVLLWMSAQSPPCPWDADDCLRRTDCPEMLRWMREEIHAGRV